MDTIETRFGKVLELFGAKGERVTVIVRAEFPFKGQFTSGALLTNDDPNDLEDVIHKCKSNGLVFRKTIPPFRRAGEIT